MFHPSSCSCSAAEKMIMKMDLFGICMHCVLFSFEVLVENSEIFFFLFCLNREESLNFYLLAFVFVCRQVHSEFYFY